MILLIWLCYEPWPGRHTEMDGADANVDGESWNACLGDATRPGAFWTVRGTMCSHVGMTRLWLRPSLQRPGSGCVLPCTRTRHSRLEPPSYILVAHVRPPHISPCCTLYPHFMQDAFVKSFTHLKDRPKADHALQLLQRTASLVKPIMRNHEWVLPVLSEFFPESPNLLGEYLSERLRERCFLTLLSLPYRVE